MIRIRSPRFYYGNAVGNLYKGDIVDFLYAVQGATCYLCGRYMRRMQATIDHVVPRARGGAHDLGNWALAHGPCNNLKGSRLPTIEELDRHAAIQSKIRRALFWMRVLAPLHRLRKRLLGVIHAHR